MYIWRWKRLKGELFMEEESGKEAEILHIQEKQIQTTKLWRVEVAYLEYTPIYQGKECHLHLFYFCNKMLKIYSLKRDKHDPSPATKLILKCFSILST